MVCTRSSEVCVYKFAARGLTEKRTKSSNFCRDIFKLCIDYRRKEFRILGSFHTNK